MKSLKSVIGALTLGVCGLAMPASADIFNPRFPVPEFHGVHGANTSSSFAACSVMGELGFSNTPPPADWETFITSACTAKTKALSPPLNPSGPPLSAWPSTCNPTGMTQALNEFTAAHWIVYQQPGTPTGQANALNETVIALQTFGSPGVVPIYGQADHWVTVTQVTATPISAGVFSITNVKGFDGGPVAGADSSTNTYNGGLQSWSGNVWKNVFFLVVTAINPVCDFQVGGCGASPFFDPFYNQYVLLFEPPVGSSQPQLNMSFDKSAGIVPEGSHAMNATLAQHRLWDALTKAGVNNDASIWDALAGTTPGQASLVNAVFPNGNPWNYFLVPLLNSSGMAVAFVQLDADDGSFQHIDVLQAPVTFTAVPQNQAAQLANGALARGERITGNGALTWDPRSGGSLARSPSFPYYEFAVTDSNGKSSTARVALHDGTTLRGH